MSTAIESTVTARTITIEGFGDFGTDVAIEVIASTGERLLVNVNRFEFLRAVKHECGGRLR